MYSGWFEKTTLETQEISFLSRFSKIFLKTTPFYPLWLVLWVGFINFDFKFCQNIKQLLNALYINFKLKLSPRDHSRKLSSIISLQSSFKNISEIPHRKSNGTKQISGDHDGGETKSNHWNRKHVKINPDHISTETSNHNRSFAGVCCFLLDLFWHFAVLVCDIHVRCVMCDIVCYIAIFWWLGLFQRKVAIHSMLSFFLIISPSIGWSILTITCWD